MVAIGRVEEWSDLVDDPNGRFLRRDPDRLDRVEATNDLGMKSDGGFDGGLRVEFGGVGDLEQDVLDHVRTQWLRQDERLAAEQRILKAPRWRREGSGVAHFPCSG